MLSYQHGYHAGNFADVIKHVGLTRLLAYLTKKDKPLFYLETHSGRGLYDFHDKQSQKIGEYKQGVNVLWPHKKTLPPVFNKYIEAIDSLNPDNLLRYYPGSPALAIKGLRREDRLYCCELHPAEFDALNKMPHEFRRVHLEHVDGIASLKALLPPPENRGLIFIDPSYELKEEYRQIPMAIKQAYNRFSNGVYCLWYPIVSRHYCDKLLRAMGEIGAKESLKIEFMLDNSSKEGMVGCGLYLINPPYTFAEEMKQALETLKTLFNPKGSSYLIETI